MYDLLLTIALIYFAYRVYQWYQRTREQPRAGAGAAPREVPLDQFGRDPIATQPGDDNDYIDYEEIKEPQPGRRSTDL